jgi:hypothetical protein
LAVVRIGAARLPGRTGVAAGTSASRGAFTIKRRSRATASSSDE